MIEWFPFNRIHCYRTWISECHCIKFRIPDYSVTAVTYLTFLKDTFIWTNPAHYSLWRLLLEHCQFPVYFLLPWNNTVHYSRTGACDYACRKCKASFDKIPFTIIKWSYFHLNEW